MTKRTRSIPACCTSAACGRLECLGCPNLPKLEAFQLWVRKTQAHPSPVDPSNLYIATRKSEGGKS